MFMEKMWLCLSVNGFTGCCYAVAKALVAG